MFKGPKQIKNLDENSSLIGAMSVVDGDVHFQNHLYIRGQIKGNIVAISEQAELSIYKSGKIMGNVKASNVLIDGRVTGNITCRSITIQSNARIEGSVYYEVLQMQANSVINGQLVMSAEYAKRKPDEKKLQKPLSVSQTSPIKNQSPSKA